MEDPFFNNDPFESIVREFFGDRRRKKNYEISDDEDVSLNYVNSDNVFYIIVELPGFEADDIYVQVKDRRIEIKAKKKSIDNVAKYLSQKLLAGISMIQTLPQGIGKEFDYTYKNGILEIQFRRKE